MGVSATNDKGLDGEDPIAKHTFTEFMHGIAWIDKPTTKPVQKLRNSNRKFSQERHNGRTWERAIKKEKK